MDVIHCFTVRQEIEFARFNVPQIKRQFNVFLNMSAAHP